jgi:hypothetical protein
MKLGLDKDGAKCVGYSRKGYWRVAQNPLINIAISNLRLERNGFLFFLPLYDKKVEQEIEKSCKYLETAVYRTVRLGVRGGLEVKL